MLDAPHDFGNATLAREDSRSVWIWPWLESFWQDAAHAFRDLRRHPSFTLIALSTLGAAIGLNTSLFTTFNTMVNRSWPVKDPERVAQVVVNRPEGVMVDAFRAPDYRVLADQVRSFSGLSAWFATTVRLDDGEASACYISGNFFHTLGVNIGRGRGFESEDDRDGALAPVMVVSYRAWQNRFGGDAGIAGREVRVNGTPFTVVGVASPEFTGTNLRATDLWIPLAATAILRATDQRASVNHEMRLVGRLADGVSRQQAAAEVYAFSQQFGPNHPASARRKGTTQLIGTGYAPRGAPAAMALILAGVLLVLLLACANVGNLLLARSAARAQEIAVRQSLGAGRFRLLRQLLTESLVLAGAGGLIGIAIGQVLPDFILGRLMLSTGSGEPAFHLRPDATALAYTAGLTLLACVAFGLAPALHASHASASRRLKGSGLRLRSALLYVQISISMVLLFSAGLLARAVAHAGRQDLGFRLHGISLVSLDLPGTYGVPGLQAFTQRLLYESGGLAATTYAPFDRMQKPSIPIEDGRAGIYAVTPQFFATLRIPLLAGRGFEPADVNRNVVVVNESMARAYPLGKTVVINKSAYEIVGVVRNSDTDASALSLEPIAPVIYRPLDSSRVNRVPAVLVETAAAQPLAALAARIDPNVRMQATPLSLSRDRLLGGSRTSAALAGVLGGLSLAMASIGIFGVFAYTVQQRTREIGIRIALGARRGQVIAVMLRSTARALTIGLAIGSAASVAASRLLASQLYGLSPLDPLAYAGVALVLALAALAATVIPARRALRVDPMAALRWE